MLTEQGFDYTPVFMFGKITTTPTTVVSALLISQFSFLVRIRM